MSVRKQTLILDSSAMEETTTERLFPLLECNNKSIEEGLTEISKRELLRSGRPSLRLAQQKKLNNVKRKKVPQCGRCWERMTIEMNNTRNAILYQDMMTRKVRCD